MMLLLHGDQVVPRRHRLRHPNDCLNALVKCRLDRLETRLDDDLWQHQSDVCDEQRRRTIGWRPTWPAAGPGARRVARNHRRVLTRYCRALKTTFDGVQRQTGTCVLRRQEWVQPCTSRGATFKIWWETRDGNCLRRLSSKETWFDPIRLPVNWIGSVRSRLSGLTRNSLFDQSPTSDRIDNVWLKTLLCSRYST